MSQEMIEQHEVVEIDPHEEAEYIVAKVKETHGIDVTVDTVLAITDAQQDFLASKGIIDYTEADEVSDSDNEDDGE